MPEKPKGPILPTPSKHTLIKHEILKKYLSAWFPILTSSNGFEKVMFIDGFAGSGIYLDGTEGSPIIAVKAALKLKTTKKIDFIFVEENEERFQTLKGEIHKLEIPSNFSCNLQQADFSETMPVIIKAYDKQPSKFRAAFVFIDPFGYKGIPLQLIKEIMRHPNCEVLITFMYDEINRFLSVEQSDQCRNDLFGTNEWQQAKVEHNPRVRKQLLHDLYQKQLKEVAGIRFIRSFQMINENNATDFYLFFGTNSPDGLREMKTAMWKVDETGSFRFSDNTDPNQSVMFGQPNFEDLKDLLLKQFDGKEVTYEEVEQFVWFNSAFRHDAHLKQYTLKPLMKKGKLQVLDPNGRIQNKIMGFSKDMTLRFLRTGPDSSNQPSLFEF